MFEQQQLKSSSSSNTQPQDIFASTDPVAEKTAGASMKINTSSPAPRSAGISSRPHSQRKSLLVFVLVVLIVGVSVGVLAFFLTKRSHSSPALPSGFQQEESSNFSEKSGEEALPGKQGENSSGANSGLDVFQPPVSEPSPSVSETVTNSPPLDDDHDGLTFEEETRLMTNDHLIDSDGDGLSDWDEVRVYKSNPLLTDTDGDSYPDGHEVQNGYSPVGPGRLNEIPQR